MSRNPVDALLIKCGLADCIPAFKAMEVERVVTLRALSPEDLEKAIPDPVKRETLLAHIRTRGNVRDAQNQHRNPDDPTRNVYDDKHGTRGSGGPGGRGGRGMRSFDREGGERGGRGGRGGGQRGGRGGGLRSDEPCRNYFSGVCSYGDNCRYSHDERLRGVAQEHDENGARPHMDRSEYIYEADIEIPTDRIKFLFGTSGSKLREINTDCHTYNDRVNEVDEQQSKVTVFKFHGKTEESLRLVRERVEAAVGIRKEEQQKERFEYAANELDTNIHTVSLFAACNKKNEGTDRALPESILRRVISTFRFTKPQDVRHFYLSCGSSDKEKLEKVTSIISSLKGVQAILFCEAKRVEEMSKPPGVGRISRTFNGVEPQFLYRTMEKSARMQALENFKKGSENDAGVKQRLLVTNEDYAKLARKTVIPYVNLVINFTVPRTEEFYLLQSLVSGRYGTVGASFLCVSPAQEEAFAQLERNIEFQKFVDEESFRLTALEMQYDTHAKPLTPENAEPPADWREHLNDEKPKRSHANNANAANKPAQRGGRR